MPLVLNEAPGEEKTTAEGLLHASSCLLSRHAARPRPLVPTEWWSPETSLDGVQAPRMA